jgi:hypothetical protein
MNRRIAHKIWKRFRHFPRAYSMEQIQQAHITLEKDIDPNDKKVWEDALGEKLTLAFPVDEQVEPVEYSKLGVSELKALCKEQGLKGYSKLKKGELLTLLGG